MAMNPAAVVDADDEDDAAAAANRVNLDRHLLGPLRCRSGGLCTLCFKAILCPASLNSDDVRSGIHQRAHNIDASRTSGRPIRAWPPGATAEDVSSIQNALLVCNSCGSRIDAPLDQTYLSIEELRDRKESAEILSVIRVERQSCWGPTDEEKKLIKQVKKKGFGALVSICSPLASLPRSGSNSDDDSKDGPAPTSDAAKAAAPAAIGTVASGASSGSTDNKDDKRNDAPGATGASGSSTPLSVAHTFHTSVIHKPAREADELKEHSPSLTVSAPAKDMSVRSDTAAAAPALAPAPEATPASEQVDQQLRIQRSARALERLDDLLALMETGETLDANEIEKLNTRYLKEAYLPIVIGKVLELTHILTASGGEVTRYSRDVVHAILTLAEELASRRWDHFDEREEPWEPVVDFLRKSEVNQLTASQHARVDCIYTAAESAFDLAYDCIKYGDLRYFSSSSAALANILRSVAVADLPALVEAKLRSIIRDHFKKISRKASEGAFKECAPLHSYLTLMLSWATMATASDEAYEIEEQIRELPPINYTRKKKQYTHEFAWH